MARASTRTTTIRASRTHIASLALSVALIAAARAAEVARLDDRTLAADESRAHAALSSLAGGPITVERAQAFRVGTGPSALDIVPVRYPPRSPGELANVDHCALVVLARDRVQVVPTIGSGYLESVGCTGLRAVGFPDVDGDGRLDVALIHATVAPPDRYGDTPVVVRRHADGTFAVDDELTAALDRRGGITTIAALRRALAERRGGRPAK